MPGTLPGAPGTAVVAVTFVVLEAEEAVAAAAVGATMCCCCCCWSDTAVPATDGGARITPAPVVPSRAPPPAATMGAAPGPIAMAKASVAAAESVGRCRSSPELTTPCAAASTREPEPEPEPEPGRACKGSGVVGRGVGVGVDDGDADGDESIEALDSEMVEDVFGDCGI